MPRKKTSTKITRDTVRKPDDERMSFEDEISLRMKSPIPKPTPDQLATGNLDDFFESQKYEILNYYRWGLSYTDIANAKLVPAQRLIDWVNKNEQRKQEFNGSRRILDKTIVVTMYQLAIGGYGAKKTVTKKTRNTKLTTTSVEETIQFLPPNLGACNRWLEMRWGDQWSDRGKLIEKLGEEFNHLSDEQLENMAETLIGQKRKKDEAENKINKQPKKRGRPKSK